MIKICNNCGQIPRTNRLCKGGLCKECKDTLKTMSTNSSSYLPGINSTYTNSNQMFSSGQFQRFSIPPVGNGNSDIASNTNNFTPRCQAIASPFAPRAPVNNVMDQNPANQYLTDSNNTLSQQNINTVFV